MKWKAALLLVCCSVLAFATQFAPTKHTDPITGDTVTVNEIMSYGSYIYSYPSKYDLVFWPQTEEEWVWFCPKSGYGSLGTDFDKLTDAEKAKLKTWLAKNYDPKKAPKTHMQKLEWVEKVYEQRNKDDAFWGRFYRLMAHLYRPVNRKKSLAYMKKTMALMDKQLKKSKDGIGRLEALFLLGEYNRRLKNIKEAKGFFDQIPSVEFTDDKGNKKKGHPFFVELAKERLDLIANPPPKLEDATQKEAAIIIQTVLGSVIADKPMSPGTKDPFGKCECFKTFLKADQNKTMHVSWHIRGEADTHGFQWQYDVRKGTAHLLSKEEQNTINAKLAKRNETAPEKVLFLVVDREDQPPFIAVSIAHSWRDVYFGKEKGSYVLRGATSGAQWECSLKSLWKQGRCCDHGQPKGKKDPKK